MFSQTGGPCGVQVVPVGQAGALVSGEGCGSQTRPHAKPFCALFAAQTAPETQGSTQPNGLQVPPTATGAVLPPTQTPGLGNESLSVPAGLQYDGGWPDACVQLFWAAGR